MCSISGVIGNVREGTWHDTYRLLTSLFVQGERRGIDSSGFAGLTEPYKDRINNTVITDKEPVPASEFIAHNKWKSLKHHRLVSAILHNRAFTTGSPLNPKNNHPFANFHGDTYLIHNGVIRNHEHIRHSEGLQIPSECDSAVLLGLIEKYQSIVQGLKMALKLVDGSMAVAVLDCSRRLLWLLRNHASPLWLCRFRNLWFFSSTSQIMQDSIIDAFGNDALKQVDVLMPLAPDIIHVLTPAGRLLAVGR